MMFFVVLSGTTRVSPLRQTYFLQADTSGITGARDVSQWTYFYVCSPDNLDCSRASPAMPFGHPWADNADNIPDGVGGSYAGGTTSGYYFYMWRFGWVFYLVGLFFAVVAFFTGFLACCGRLGSAVSGLISLTALIFFTVAVTLMTYVSIPRPLYHPELPHADHYTTVPHLSRPGPHSALTTEVPRSVATLLGSAGARGLPCSSRQCCSSWECGLTVAFPDVASAGLAARGATARTTWVLAGSRRITRKDQRDVGTASLVCEPYEEFEKTRCCDGRRDLLILVGRCHWLQASRASTALYAEMTHLAPWVSRSKRKLSVNMIIGRRTWRVAFT